MSEPICKMCGLYGNGILFPMLPKATRFKFGEICVDCDKYEADAEAAAR